MMQTNLPAIAAVAAFLMLAGCGHSASDRALSGAGIGAGIGALGGALVGGSPAAGAIIGGAAGAAIGGFTDHRDFDLGKPIWR